ncbi:MAG TPA: hypothetical protein ENK76_05355, partial [Campylobacterales bacterium]|nr:hypothetical protein [Campylobacterales bacterium]
LNNKPTDIVFAFGDRDTIKKADIYEKLKILYPKADIVGCSSSGNILGDSISDASIVAIAISFDKGRVEISVEDFSDTDNQCKASYQLIENLPKENLQHIFILSDGLNMNGSFLAKGANQAVTSGVTITGGLAGDGIDFEETWVIANDIASQNRMVAVGFYGESFHISSGCYAGWEEFGIYRRITKSINNIVYEIDGKPALDLYKKYLGEYAENLSANGLRFPFNIKKENEDYAVIRSVLSVDEDKKALIFAGDVPNGSFARLMKSDIDGLIDGSEMAASNIKQYNTKTALGLVVSCIGRRVILNQLSDEELESIADILGDNVELTGFYSYGELAPYSDKVLSCQLHNQTMTLTVIYED